MYRLVPLSLLCLICALAGCPQPAPQQPRQAPSRTIATSQEYWEPNIEGGEETFVVTDTAPVVDTVANARTELRDRALKRAVELTVKDLMRDPDAWYRYENEIRRLFVNQFQKYIASHTVLQASDYAQGTRLGMKIRVVTAREKLQRDLQREGIFETERVRVILVLRRPAEGAAEVSSLAQGYLDDLAERLSEELLLRGFRTRHWKDVRIRRAARRDAGDQQMEEFLTRFIEESDWRRPEDERYQIPLLLLRKEGRLLVGFRVLELKKQGNAYHGVFRADAYDLLNRQSLGYETESDTAVIAPGQSLLQARQALIDRSAKALMQAIGGKIQTFLSREKRLRSEDYHFTFEGFEREEIEKLETLLAGVITERLDSEVADGQLIVRATIPRDPIPLRDEIKMLLDYSGWKVGPVDRSGTRMTFVKE